MPKTSELTGLEAKIYSFASKARKGIITMDIIDSWGLAKKSVLKVVLSKMVRKGLLMRLKKGVYAFQPLGARGMVGDVFEAGSEIFGGYIGFATALNIYGLMDEVPFTVYVVTVNKSGRRELGQYEIKAVAMGKRAVGTTEYNGIFISTIPKTIYDCLHIPEYGGGYPKILKAISLAEMDAEGWEEFLGYAERFGSAAFCQKIGYLLERMRDYTGIAVPEFVLERLHKKVKSTVRIGEERGKYNAKWKVSDGFREEELFGWWY
ncbi:MAG: type IV toxin-antitoxin system AbiEi family antitoxin domain-containing protein [Candidatus Micrarchaeota archaeon]